MPPPSLFAPPLPGRPRQPSLAPILRGALARVQWGARWLLVSGALKAAGSTGRSLSGNKAPVSMRRPGVHEEAGPAPPSLVGPRRHAVQRAGPVGIVFTSDRRRPEETLGTGERFALWDGHDLGLGVITRRIFV